MNGLMLPRSSLFAVAAVLTALIYAGAWSGDFQFDDSVSILQNPHLESGLTFMGHLGHMVRPVLYATFLVDRSLYGISPVGYHALNLLLHLGSGFLVYRILCHAITPHVRAVPLWTALLFLIHPIQTEAVTYISGRASGFMAFFYLLALALYIEGTLASSHIPAIRRRYMFGALMAFLLALGTKETAITLPVALLLWDVLIRQVHASELRARFVTYHLPFWLILVLAGAWAHWNSRYAALANFSFGIRSIWDNVLDELHAAIYALGLLCTPWNQNIDHDLPLLRSLFEWPLPIDLAIFGMLAAVAVAAVRRQPLISFGLAWYVLQFVPIAIIPRNDLLSERNLYLASIGILLVFVVVGSLVASWLMKALARPTLVRLVLGGLATVLVLLLCLATVHRNALYGDALLLWSDAVAKSPQKARPHNNLGHSYAERGNWEKAIEHFRMAARLDSEYTVAQENLRDAYLHKVGRR